MQTLDTTIGGAIRPTKRAYTIAEAVFASGIGRTALYEANSSGQLPFRKHGKRTLILADDLDTFLSDLPLSKASL